MPGDSDVTELNDDTTTVRTRPCWICGQYSFIEMPWEAWDSFNLNDLPLDVVWPEGSAADKQLLTTGTHPKCWSEEYPDDVPKET